MFCEEYSCTTGEYPYSKARKKHRKKLGNDLDRLGWKLGRQQEKENVEIPHIRVTFGPLTSKAQSAILYSSDQVSVTLRGLRPQGDLFWPSFFYILLL